MKRQEGLETLVGVVWELRLVPSAGNTFLLPVSAGHLCSVAPEAQLAPTEVSQDIFSLNLGKSLLPGRSTPLDLGQPCGRAR